MAPFHTRLIGLVGKKQTGKDTVYNILVSYCANAARLAFADPLKQELSKALGVSVEFMEDHKEVFRPIYQWYGTDFRRGLFGDDYWLVKADRSLEFARRYDRLIVFTDCRFLNEAEFIRKKGGRIWRVIRDKGLTVDPHASETEQDAIKHDNCIVNNGTLEQLRYCVESVYRSEFKK
jgi:hypothetical protein